MSNLQKTDSNVRAAATVEVIRGTDMKYFDALPRRVREALQAADNDFSAQQAFDAFIQHGEAAVTGLIKANDRKLTRATVAKLYGAGHPYLNKS